jgi:hypothetical protein
VLTVPLVEGPAVIKPFYVLSFLIGQKPEEPFQISSRKQVYLPDAEGEIQRFGSMVRVSGYDLPTLVRIAEQEQHKLTRKKVS